MLQYLAGPVVGTIIGYGTNYVAVKMLFRPKKEIKIWGHTLPFTPGAIPKGRDRLARSIGEIVGKNLVTEEDIKSKLLSETAQNAVIGTVTEHMTVELKQEIMTLCKLDDEMYQQGRDKLQGKVCDKIVSAVNDLNLGSIIAEESGRVIREKTQNSMLKMLINKDVIESITKVIGCEVQKYIDKNGESIVNREVGKQIADIEGKSVTNLLEEFSVSNEKVQSVFSTYYCNVVEKCVALIFQKIDIAKMIEEKINAMDMDEIERLVLSVMKKELDTIVNLGAVIGFVLGLLNTLLAVLVK